MISDVRAGKINLVIVKDLSRFGRDYIETGKFIDVIFPSLNCRFIALNDGVDTLQHNNEMLAIFKNVMNDFYARDTSSKIKAVRQSTCKTGKYIGCYAPYGYIKDPADTHHFIIDEPAAAIVRKVFSLRLTGIGYRAIAQKLNEEGIIPPRDYWYQLLGRSNPRRKNGFWNTETVKKIVRNEVYLGHMVQNKRGTVSYKDHKQIDKPKDQWIRVENTHEPIIDQDTWNLAVEIDQMHTNPRDRSGEGVSTFGGLLFCMDCGYALRHQMEHHKRKNGTVAAYSSYVCGKYSMSGRTACSTHNIYETALMKVVLADIRMKAEILCKSISRLSRNFAEAQQYVHELKAINVEIRFEKEGISSFDPSSDMIFSTMAAVAQEESRSISENIKWTYKRLAEQGIRHVGNNHMLGYDEVEGKLTPNKDAWIVKLMFEEYAAGAAPSLILQHLREKGARRMRSDREFTWSSVLAILKNEAYVGDRLLQKTAPQNYLTKEPDPTQPYDSKYIYNDHEGIIAPAVWDAVQDRFKHTEKAKETGLSNRATAHFLYGKVFCAECGEPYRRFTANGSNGYYKTWRCRGRTHASGCGCRHIKEKDLLRAISEQFGWPWKDEDSFDSWAFLEMAGKVLVSSTGIEIIEAQGTHKEQTAEIA